MRLMNGLWNNHQERIFASTELIIVVVAGPGCGKTTTLIELANRALGKSVIAVAFGKGVARELEDNLSNGVARTTHSVGYETVRNALGNQVKTDPDRAWKLAEEVWPGRELNRLKQALTETLTKCKARLAHTYSEIDSVIDDHLISTEPLDRENFIVQVIALLNHSARPTVNIDFDDQLWLPVVCPWMTPKQQYELVLVDEVQDFTSAQLRFVLRLVKPGGRLVMFGDPHQAIFGFRGAGGMQSFAQEIGAKSLPLSICYRCGSKIVEEARRFVPELEPAPNCKTGQVVTCTLPQLLKEVRPGDFVISRSNAPLVKLCMQFLRDGKRAQIEGRDIGKTLAAFVRKQRASDPEDLVNKVRAWAAKEAVRLAESVPPKSADAVWDRCECVLAFCEGAQTVEQILDRIDEAFSAVDRGAYVTFSTAHRAKGKEADRVWVLETTFSKNVKRLEIEREKEGKDVDAKLAEENNIRYVAITRAREFLAYVDHDFKSDLQH